VFHQFRQMRLQTSRLSDTCKLLLTLWGHTPNMGVRKWVNRRTEAHGADGPSCNQISIIGG
jgi:hypothetical protein